MSLYPCLLWADLTCDPTPQLASSGYEFSTAKLPPLSFDHQINHVYVSRLPIFNEQDPKEDYTLFRWANRFHYLTRERVIREQLLIKAGDPYVKSTTEESARLLRNRDHVYDAAVRAVSLCDNQVDLEVITQDVWSFTPELSFDRSGGDDTYRVGLRDTNFLGTATEWSVALKEDLDRRSLKYVFEDDNLRGSWIATRLAYTDSDDGTQTYARIGLPFYALDSRTAWNITHDSLTREENQYFKGEKVSNVDRDTTETVFSLGFSRGLQNGRAQRWSVGYVYRTDEFTATGELPPPMPFPTDRKLSYPFIQYQSLEDNYATVNNLNQIYRTEDIYLGREWISIVGFAARAFGSDQDRLLVRGRLRDTLRFTPGRLLQHSFEWRGYWNADRSSSEDVKLDYLLTYFRRQSPYRTFHARMNVAYTRNMNTNQQLVLGGLYGARGFENRFQSGDRRLLLTLEQRQYTDIHFFNLVRLGFALFVDVGRAWQPGTDDGLAQPLLADLGFGIRLASSKADVGKIIHIDFALPLTNRDDPSVESVQVAVNIKNSF
jgi:outer membrane protein assembly factor BamA